MFWELIAGAIMLLAIVFFVGLSLRDIEVNKERQSLLGTNAAAYDLLPSHDQMLWSFKPVRNFILDALGKYYAVGKCSSKP